MTKQPPVVEEAEVAVVGAGPCGAVCARTLAELGHDVVLIDQSGFPRDKPCGDGLTRSSVAFLRRLGLERLVDEAQPIEGARVVLEHRRTNYRRYSSDVGSAPACCVSRRTLDQALLDSALAGGARFVRARAEGPMMSGQSPCGVRLTCDSGQAHVRAAVVVAADGATSRMRRETGSPRRGAGFEAFAVRDYFTTERRLDPLFEFYLPLVFEGQATAGYGWVFPLDEHLANIGIGFLRRGGVPSPPPIRRAFSAFVEELAVRARRRLGDIKSVGKPFGSPLGMDFDLSRCELPNLLFAGDAARTTDPLSGEGISYAMYSGELVARETHARLRGRPAKPVGLTLARRFPRIVQDISLMGRLWIRTAATETEGGQSGGAPFATTLRRMAVLSEEHPSVETAELWPVVAEHAPDVGEALRAVDVRALDELRTRFPLATELLHRHMRGGVGPQAAATLLLCARSSGSPLGSPEVDAAFAVEALALFPELLGRLAERPRSRQAKFANALAVLMADYAMSRSLLVAARIDGATARALAHAARTIAQAAAEETASLYSLDRSPTRRLGVLEGTSGAVGEFAAALGTKRAAPSSAVHRNLAVWARAVCVAFAVSEDARALLEDDDATGRKVGDDLRRGAYPLPVLFALSRSPRLRRLLTRGVERDEMSLVVELVEDAGGFEAATAECRRYVDEASAAARRSGVRDVQPLLALADLAANRIATERGTPPALVAVRS